MSSQLQTNNKTFLGRYWTEHSVLRRYLPTDAGLSVLSFGCSTGEEMLGLRALFPSAQLFGCDTDWHNLQAARALLGAGVTIFESSPRTLSAHGPFDVIVCNSVLLQPTRTVNGVKVAIPPNVWLDAVSQLDAALKPGGILQIINSNIPFRLHPVADSYEPLSSRLVLGPHFVDQFGVDGEHLCTGIGGGGWSSLMHRHAGEAGWPRLEPGDLQNVHFRKAGGEAPLPPIHDECIPTLPAGPVLARGTQSYRTVVDPGDSRPSTYVDVDVSWATSGVDAVRLERTARRTWFDGRVVWEGRAAADLTGTAAAAFIESSLGRRSTRLTLEELLVPRPIRASGF